MKRTSLALLDSDLRRRARATDSLLEMKMHVEPYESTAEISSDWHGADAILVYDEPGAIAEVVNLMCETDKWIVPLAYAEEPVPSRIVAALHEGASGYLSWPFSVSELNGALQRADQPSNIFTSTVKKQFHARKLVSRVTQREMQVLGCVAWGMSNREIGHALDISKRTVEVHRANLLRRMGIQHTADAIRIAIEAGLDGPNSTASASNQT